MQVSLRKWAVLFTAIVAVLLAAFVPAMAFAGDTGLTSGSFVAQGGKESTNSAKDAYVKSTTKLNVNNAKGGLISNGAYYIAEAEDSSKVLGSKGVVQTKKGSKSQRWKLKFSYDTQCYTITNADTGKVLTVRNKAKKDSKVGESSLVKKAQKLSVYATRTVAIPTQRWVLHSDSNGYYFVSAANKRVVLDLSGDHARVVAKKTMGKECYLWFTGAAGSFVDNGIGKGTYTIKSQSKDATLNISNSSLAKKAKARFGKARTNWGQMFDFIPLGKGYYRINSYNSGMALTATSGGRVLQVPYGGVSKKYQLWKIEVVESDGGALLVNKASGKALTAEGEHGVILQNANAEEKDQRWIINPTTTGLTYVGKKALYKANKHPSATPKCIVIDMTAHEYFLFKKAIRSKKGGPWTLEDTCRCATGRNKATEPAVTTTNDYAVHKPGRINGKWCISVNYGSDIHSIVYDGAQGEHQLGWYLSGGCIRLPFENAEYVYKHTKEGTKCIRYY